MKYDVVCTLGWNNEMLNTVEADSEREARKIVWDKFLTEEQRNNCQEIEVFELDCSDYMI
jgi:hypothetical protein